MNRLTRLRHIPILRIELYLFYFSVLDILFLPYVFWIATTYSQIFVVFWFFSKKRVVFRKNEYKLFWVLIYIVLLSTAISFFTVPSKYYYSEGLIENIKRGIQLIFSITYYFFFYYIFSTYKINIKKILFLFVLFIAIWGVIYYNNFELFVLLKSFFNSKDSFLGMIDGSYIYRFSFIWSDPNNIGYSIVGVVIFLLCNCNLEFFKGWIIIFILFFILMLTMSSGSWLSLALFFPISFFLWIVGYYKRMSNISRLILLITLSFIIALLIYEFIQFQKSEIGMMAMERIENNSGDSRFIHWKNTLEDKIIPLYILFGEGYQTFVNGIPYSPHSGHLLLYFGYGFIGYLIFMYITFRKRKNIPVRNYLFVLPFLFCFTVNIGIGELKFTALLYMLIAKMCIDNIYEDENLLYRALR